jgi:hypothetical protein
MTGTQPLGASTSSVKVLGPTDTQGNINITLEESPLVVPGTDMGHALFSAFST